VDREKDIVVRMSRTTEILGFDHVYLTVQSLATSEAFYDRVLIEALGFRKTSFVIDGAPHINYFNRHFGLVLRPARAGAPKHDPYAPGLHHLCLRVAEPSDVDRVAETLAVHQVTATPPRLSPEYAPDYYATYLVDPDGIRLEITNFRAERKQRMDQWESLGRND
jgi:glyoxylase I family protein